MSCHHTKHSCSSERQSAEQSQQRHITAGLRKRDLGFLLGKYIFGGDHLCDVNFLSAGGNRYYRSVTIWVASEGSSSGMDNTGRFACLANCVALVFGYTNSCPSLSPG